MLNVSILADPGLGRLSGRAVVTQIARFGAAPGALS